MTVSELRIGNWVTVMGSLPQQVTGYHIFMMETYRPKDKDEASYEDMTQPIPLTEEWLLKFGFQLHSVYSFRNFMLPKNKFFICRWMEDKPSVGVEETGAFYWSDRLLKIEYVHQLQNLFHALTGEELTITEP